MADDSDGLVDCDDDDCDCCDAQAPTLTKLTGQAPNLGRCLT